MRSSNSKRIELGDDFGDVAVEVNGTRVEISAQGTITVRTNSEVNIQPPANDGTADAVGRDPWPGDLMADGTVFAGYSPDTGEALYAMPQDAPATLQWRAARKYAADMNAHGHSDWRVPSAKELSVLYVNRGQGALKDTFNDSSAAAPLPEPDNRHWYWSSDSPGDPSLAYNQNFIGGKQSWNWKINGASVRLVRTGPAPNN